MRKAQRFSAAQGGVADAAIVYSRAFRDGRVEGAVTGWPARGDGQQQQQQGLAYDAWAAQDRTGRTGRAERQIHIWSTMGAGDERP